MTEESRFVAISHDTVAAFDTGKISRRHLLSAAGGAGLLSATVAGAGTPAAAMAATPRSAATGPFTSLRDYVAAMEAHGNVMRFDRVDQDAYEATAVMYRLVDQFGTYRAPLVIFEELKINGRWVKGPLIANQLRHVDAEALLFGMQPVPHDNIATWHRARAYHDQVLAENGGDYPQIAPREIPRDQAPCKEVTLSGDEIDVTRFPFIQNNPGDSGRFVNTASVFTYDPKMGLNIGTYRCEIKGPRHIAVGSGEGQTGYNMLMAARERGEKSAQVTLIVGQEPMVWLVSGARIPNRIGNKPVDEMAYAGGLRGSAIEVVKCDTNEFRVPATTEMVIEGTVSLESFENNGPYAESPGYMGAAYESAFTMTVERITHRRDPWLTNDFTGVTGPLIEAPSTALVVAGLKSLNPNVVNYRYLQSVNYISINKTKPGEAAKLGRQLARLIPTMKIVIMVDGDIDLWRDEDRFHAFATRWQPSASEILENQRGVPLEPSSPARGFTSKIVIDATRQWPEEGGPETFPELSRNILEEHAPDLFQRIDEKWGNAIKRRRNI